MAEGDIQNTRRVTDWIILVFVLVVMGLLIADLGSNVMDALNRDSRPDDTRTSAPVSPDGKLPTF